MRQLRYTGNAQIQHGGRTLGSGDIIVAHETDANALLARPDFEEAEQPKEPTRKAKAKKGGK